MAQGHQQVTELMEQKRMGSGLDLPTHCAGVQSDSVALRTELHGVC